MSTQQLITILSVVAAGIVYAVSHMKVSKTSKIILSILFLAVMLLSTKLNWSYLEKKEAKEAAHEIKIDQIDTHVRASLRPEGFIEAAKMNRQLGRLDEAIYDVQCALEREPKSSRALNLLGVLYFLKGDYDKAIEAYSKIKAGLSDSSIAISSGEYMYHRNFAEAYMEKNMWKKAKEELHQCLSLNDNDLICYLDLSKTLNRLAESQELYNLCKKGLTKFPTSAALHSFLGLACIEISRLDEGEEALLEAVQADSTSGRPYLFLGLIYSLKKQPEESAKFINRALELDPTLTNDVENLKKKKLLP